MNRDNRIATITTLFVMGKLGYKPKMRNVGHQYFKGIRSWCLLMLLLMVSPLAIQAQTPSSGAPKADSTKDMAGLVVPQPDNAPGIRAVLTAEQMARFADYSVADGLARIPGIQTNLNGQLNLRGVGYNRFYVTVDGQRLGTTGSGERSVDLNALSADMIQQVEVIKVLTPAMDADGLAGAINLKTRDAQSRQSLQLRAGGGASTQYIDRTGLNSRLWGHYAGSVGENVNMTLTVSHQSDQRGRDQLSMNYQSADLGNGPVDVLESVSPGVQTDGRQRFGGNIHLNFTPGSNQSYEIRATLNYDDRSRIRHNDVWQANGDWDTPDTTGFGGTYTYNVNRDNATKQMYTVQASGHNDFENLLVDYSVGWAYSDANSKEYNFPFQRRGLELAINTSDRARPTMQTVDDFPNAEDIDMEDLNYVLDHHIDRKYSANVDFEIPLDVGSIQFGGNVRSTSKEANDQGAYSNYTYSYIGFVDLSRFIPSDEGPINVFDGKYRVPWDIDSQKAVSFFKSSIPNMRLDDRNFHRTSDIWNYGDKENIYGGYGMTTLNFGHFRLLAGARVEYTDLSTDGKVVDFNRFDRYEDTRDTSATNSYVNLFPNIQLTFKPDSKTSFQLAYSQTIERPQFNLMAPFQLVTARDTSFFKGNPDLEPMTSQNIDFFAERSLGQTGALSVGLFYKKLNDFIYLRQRSMDLRDGDNPLFADYFNDQTSVITAKENIYDNGDENASLYGVEVSWQQNLAFLPGLLSNLGVYANYTWTQSDFDAQYRSGVDLPGQSPHVVNAALEYADGRFSGQVSYHWSAKALTGLAREKQLAAAAGNKQVYMDQYYDGASSLSATFRFRITDHFNLWADASGLLQQNKRVYEYDRTYYPRQIYYRDGFNFLLGLRYNL